jgi:hypothetical protein
MMPRVSARRSRLKIQYAPLSTLTARKSGVIGMNPFHMAV